MLFQQIDQHMDEDVFQAFRFFGGEFGVEEEGAGVRLATAPFGFHVEDGAAVGLHTGGAYWGRRT